MRLGPLRTKAEEMNMRISKGTVWPALAAAFLLIVGLSAPAGQENAKNLGPAVNSADSDFGPIVTADGKTLYFTSTREGGQGYQDIWVSRREAGGEWSRALNLGAPINTEYNEGPDSLSVDEKTMFFTRCDKIGSPGICDIYTASWDKEKKVWTGITNLGEGVNTQYNDTNASISHDGKTLYFVSDRPVEEDGPKNWDIFRSTLKDGKWAKAERLPAPINTPDNEIHVMIHPDNETLYFCSDGHKGLGGSDAFMSKIKDGVYGEPVNLGDVINTSGDDIYFTIPASGDLAYLASDRSGTLGMEDIYSVPIPMAPTESKGVVIVRGVVADASSCSDKEDVSTCKPLPGVKVTILDAEGKSSIKETVSAVDGVYQLVVPAGENILVSAAAPGFKKHVSSVNAKDVKPYQTLKEDLLLEK